MRKREPASMPQAVSACMRSVRGPEATEPPLAGRSSCRLGRYAASAALSTKAIGSRLRSTWTRVSSRPPRPPRARLLDSAGLVGDRTSSPLPRRPRSRNFSCWTCQNAATETSVSPQHQTTARRVREQCRKEGSAGARVCGKAWPFLRSQCTLTWFSVAAQKLAPGSSAVAAVPAVWAGLAAPTGRKKSMITMLTPARRNEPASTAHWWS